jgi:hypothetical protein
MGRRRLAKSVLTSRFGNASEGIIKNRIIAALYGEDGSGKTHFALTAPGPIVVQSIDNGLEGVAMEEYGKKEIFPIEYEWDPTTEPGEDEDKAKDRLQELAIELREKIREDFDYACKHARTVVWDKETGIWEVYRYAQFGGPNDAPRNYPKLNQTYMKCFNIAKRSDVNFLLLQGMKDEWKTISKADNNGAIKEKGASTGNRIRSGFGDLKDVVHVNIHMQRKAGDFLFHVGKSRGPGGKDVQDQTFTNLDFPTFAQLVFPDSDESDWL